MTTLLTASIHAAPVSEDPLTRRSLHPVTVLPSASQEPVWLVKGGQPQASIWIESPTNAVLKLAAEELQTYIEKATGARLPIAEKRPEQGNCVILKEQVADEIPAPADRVKAESFLVRTGPNTVTIVGYGPAFALPWGGMASGTLWGVCDFLERFVGVRWYYPGELGTVIPRMADLKVGPAAYRGGPVYSKRVIWGVQAGRPELQRVRPVKNERLVLHFRTSDTSGVPAAAPHTPSDWARVYFKEHPEYFQMGGDGQRVPPVWCYSEPAVLRQFVQDLERFYQTDGQWREPWGKGGAPGKEIIPFSPMDLPIACQCPACRRLANPGSQLGSASQIMGEFVRNLCCEVKPRWPDKIVYYLPYMNYTEPPRDIVFPDNLAIQRCWMRTVANLKEPEILRKEMAIAEGWRKIVSRPMSHYIYTVWPHDCTRAPFLYPHAMQKFFQLNRGSLGFFADAAIAWDARHLTHYLMSRLMWDPDCDVDAAVEDYCVGMYGPAAGTMREILTLLIDGWEKSRWEPPLPDYHQISLKNVHQESYPRATVLKMQELANRAVGEADQSTIESERVLFFKGALDPFFEESKNFHEGTAKRTLEVLRVAALPKMDGTLDDEVWKQAPAAHFVTLSKENPQPRQATTVKGLWIPGQGLVFGFQLAEPDLEGVPAAHTGRDELVYLDDCVEIFLDPKGERSQFFQIVTNLKGAIFDARYDQPRAAWNGPGIVVKTAKGQDAWTIEIFIPFEDVEVRSVRTGDVWFGNFTRSRSRPKEAPELSRFSTSYDLGQLNSNLNALNFGQIKFIE